MPPDLVSIRKQLAVLARQKRKRTSVWLPNRPTEWQPYSVINPEDQQPFTDAGAWEFLADLLDQGHPIEVVPLSQPAGKTGYVLEVVLDDKLLYVKLQLGTDQVIGRSFHYSKAITPGGEDGGAAKADPGS